MLLLLLRGGGFALSLLGSSRVFLAGGQFGGKGPQVGGERRGPAVGKILWRRTSWVSSRLTAATSAQEGEERPGREGEGGREVKTPNWISLLLSSPPLSFYLMEHFKERI